MTDEPEDEYFLGAGDDDGPADDHRNRKAALIGLAVVVVLVTVAITLTSLLVHTSSTPGGPRGAAQKWASALVHGDSTARRRLECPSGAHSGDVLTLIVSAATGVSTGTAQQTDPDTWRVPVRVKGPDGSTETSATLTVTRSSGRYLIC